MLSEIFEVDRVATIRDAVQRLRSDPPVGVVLLDLTLPDGAGVQIIQRLQGEFCHVPIVVITGRDDMPAARAIHAGAQEFLHKPIVSTQALQETIAKAIARHKVREEFCELDTEIAAVKEGLDASVKRMDRTLEKVDKAANGSSVY